MNERLEQFAKECTKYYHSGLGTEIEIFDKEKFADLLIFECIKLATFKGDKKTAAAIKEHFGFEL